MTTHRISRFSIGWIFALIITAIFTAAEGAAEAATFTLWPSTAVPTVVDEGPDSAVELGVKFRSDSSGYVTGIRFYKAATNTGTHVANLWSADGTRLATGTFISETASGWQQFNFPAPVAITANTIYVASYHTNVGHYSDDQDYFSGKGADNPPLHAVADGASGFNGVYAYGSTSSFPNQGWRSSNYWVDVVFANDAPDTTPPAVTAFTLPAAANSLIVPITSFTATDNSGVAGYMVKTSSTNPSATAAGWSTSPPGSYTFSTAGTKTLYAWAKDAAGNVSASKSASVTITLQSTGPEPAGWYAGDMHVHRSCGGLPESISSVYQKMTPQNLAAISLLADMGNGEVQDPAQDLPRVNGQDDPVSTPGRIVHWDAEWHWDPVYWQYPHQAIGGHVVALGLSEAHQIREEYTYPIFDWAHNQNGIAGFAHMQYLPEGIPQSLNCCIPLEYPVEVALGAADFISMDVINNSFLPSAMNSENAVKAYYRLLNSGFRPGFAAGTDHPCNDGSTVGSPMTYAQVADGNMTYRNWIDGIARGRTVVSLNGHNEFLDLKLNGVATPGDEIKLTGSGNVQVTVTWTSKQNLTGTIELVHNGAVAAGNQASVAPGLPAGLSTTVNFTKSGWLAARRMGSNGHQVHTAAVFVTVDNAPVRASAADAEYFVQWIDNLLEKTSPGGAWNLYFKYSLSAAQTRYQSAKSLFQQIALEAGSTPPAPTEGTIFTTQTPNMYENDSAYELGTKFRADVSGQIRQARLYSNASEGGTHTVRIWRAGDATLLAGPFTWNIPSGAAGWKTFTLPAPLQIAANTDYIVAVSNSSDKYYAEANHGFDTPIVNGHLHTYAGSGVYTLTPGAMPTATWENTNYFRDVVFVPDM